MSRRRAIAVGATCALVAVAAAVLVSQPRDGVTVSFGALQVTVPADWTVHPDSTLNADCLNGGHQVWLETRPQADIAHFCPASGPIEPVSNPLSLEIQPLTHWPVSETAPVIQAGDLRGRVVSDAPAHSNNPNTAQYAVAFPEQEAVLVFWGPSVELRQDILDTVRATR